MTRDSEMSGSDRWLCVRVGYCCYIVVNQTYSLLHSTPGHLVGSFRCIESPAARCTASPVTEFTEVTIVPGLRLSLSEQAIAKQSGT